MNKKGFVLSTSVGLLMIVGIIALILLGAFLFSGMLRTILIGIGLFGGVIYLLGTVKDDRIKVVSVLILVLIAVGFIFSAGVIQTVFGVSSITVFGEGDFMEFFMKL